MSYSPRVARSSAAAGLLVVAVFLALELPAYVGFDRASSRVPTHPEAPLYYPMLVGHILFGSVALLAGCLQAWPRLRARRPRVHRRLGRVYLFGGVFPAGVLVLGVAPLSSTGFASSLGNTLLAVLWLVSGVAGWRTARRRRFAEHRVWMLRSMALTTSIVANRVWLVALLGSMPVWRPYYGLDQAAATTAAATASVWLSWVVNLLLVEWFLARGPRRDRRVAGPAGQAAPSPASA